MTDEAKNASAAGEPDTFSRDYVQTLRSENAKYRQRAEEESRAAERARTEANARVIRAELRAAATQAGIIDLDGLKLADISGVTLDEAGAIQGADGLLTKLREAKPYLFAAGAGARTSSSNPGAAPSPAQGQARNAKNMSKEEYERELKRLTRR